MDENNTKQELNDLLGQTAALMNIFQQECKRICSELDDTGHHFNEQIQNSLEQQRHDINRTVVSTVDTNLKQTLENYQQQLKKAGLSLNQSTQKFDQELTKAVSKNKALVWKAWIATCASLALLLIGGGWLIFQYKAQIEENKISADILKIYNQADMSLCDGRLCVKLDKSAKKYGEYVLVKNK